jgi:disulfide bond formation protein DsbB
MLISVTLILLSAAFTGALAIYAWRHRQMPGGTAFAVMMVAATSWSFTYALEITSVSNKLYWYKLGYVGVVSAPISWLVFALQYSGKQKLLAQLESVRWG